MSTDKYPSIFLRQMATIVYNYSQVYSQSTGLSLRVTTCNTYHQNWLSMLDTLFLLWVKLPLANTIHPQCNKGRSDSKLNIDDPGQ